jgi:predicted dehydrogenase
VHAQTSIAALLGGANVLCEKPFAPSREHAREMIQAARAAGRHLVIMQNRRYHPGVRAVRRLITQGAIGILDMVCADFFISLEHGGFREAMAHILLEDMAIHTFDAARYMTGCNAVTAWADSWSGSHSWFTGGASCVAHFRMQHGVRFTYRGSWTPIGCATSWESQWRFLGSRGTLLWDGHQQIVVEAAPDTQPGQRAPKATPQPVEQPPAEDFAGGFIACIKDFLRAIDQGTTAETDARDNAHSLAMVLAALESVEHQRMANVDDFTA